MKHCPILHGCWPASGDGGPALNWHWVSVVLICGEHRHQLEFVIRNKGNLREVYIGWQEIKIW